ncbi:MAG: acetylornithine transaminase [Nitrospiraceae bacterium]|nr:acetylornithine transaminase [Nitrospiraceae bacterium]MDA8090956.1 acetylornithine transaminase [Nitrospiraceae bacterium]
MESDKIFEESTRYLMDTYGRLPVAPRKGRGVRIWSADDREYLDFVGGIAVNVLGHCHPKVVVAIQKQAQRLIHVSNLYYIENQVKLARLLVEHSFADKAFFCNSGAEANEGAIKLARKYSRTVHGEGKYEIVAALNSFHGRTYGALSATGQTKFHAGFEPMLPGFVYVPFGDAEALKKAVAADRTCAVLLEPIQAEGGVRVPPPDYFRQVREICDTSGALLILDEVQTGMGRTGELFAYKHFGIKPDIMTLAKGLGGGVPIGAVLGTDRVAKAFTPGSHAATFGGNPLVCAAAIATIQTLLEDSQYLLEHCKRMGAYLSNRLSRLIEAYPQHVLSTRGIGLLQALELARPCAPVVRECMGKGLLINCTAENVLRFMPPLIVQETDIDQAVDILAEVLKKL